jgi:hypothetical protein
MKKALSPLFVILVSLQLLAINALNAQTGTWTKLTNMSPHENMGDIMLLTNGNVISHDTVGGSVGQGWDMLTPDASGSYINGTWTTIASMHNDRFAFSSQVLPSGDVWVAGGEYGAGDTASELYNPLTNTWTIIGGMPTNGTERYHTWNVYDAPSELLYTGVVLDGPEIGHDPSFDCLFYTPSTNRLTVAPSSNYNHDEAQWIKLPDSSVLFVGIASENSNRYIPQTNTWINDANLPVNIYDPYGEESGCGLMLPNGKAIFFGATVNNCIYTPSGNTSPGTWAAAATFPGISETGVGQPDAPGAMMVNGHILLAVSPVGTSAPDEFRTPTWFVEYDYTTNTFTQVTSIIPGIGADSLAGIVSQQLTFLDLPDGNVLMALDQDYGASTQFWEYTPGSEPIAQGKPTINSVLPDGCPNYKLTGKLFNGISEGSSFGDDLQNATNYPIVRLTNGTNVYYARTSLWNRIGAVQTDSLEDTVVFTLPVIPVGTYSLYVVVNGFASNPTLFTVFGISSVSVININCANATGKATVTANGEFLPLTYTWTPGGNTNATASNLSAGVYNVTVKDGNGCTASASVTITLASSIFNVTASATANVACNGSNNGVASSTVSGGTPPYTYNWSLGGSNSTASGLIAGTYTVTVNDSCGILASAAVTITQPSVFNVIVDSINSFISGACDGSAWAVVSGGTLPYTYLWTTGAQTTDSITNQCAGNYCVIVTDANECTQTVCVTISTPTGTDNIESKMDEIIIYPNPNNGQFIIKVSDSSGQKSIVIYNILGQDVMNEELSSESNQIDLYSQPAGIYFYRVLKENRSLIGEGKIVIEK